MHNAIPAGNIIPGVVSPPKLRLLAECLVGSTADYSTTTTFNAAIPFDRIEYQSGFSPALTTNVTSVEAPDNSKIVSVVGSVARTSALGQSFYAVAIFIDGVQYMRTDLAR